MGFSQKTPSGRWRARPKNGPAKTFDKKVDADDYWQTTEKQIKTGDFIDMSNKKTVLDQVNYWVSLHPENRFSTKRSTESDTRLHVAGSRLGKMRLVDVRNSHIQKWANELHKLDGTPLAPTTVQGIVYWINGAFNQAVRDGEIRTNPVKGVKLPKDDRLPLVPLTPQQVAALARAVPDYLYAAIVTMAGLGLRLGELLGLREENIKFFDQEVEIQWQAADSGKGRMLPKTSRSRRKIPMSSQVANALAEHMRKYPPLPDGTLFYSFNTNRRHDPKQHSRSGFRFHFYNAVKKADLPAGTHPHDLRHHFVSVHLDHGESEVTIAAWMGDRVDMVRRIYGHLMPDAAPRGRKNMDDAWGEAFPELRSA
jgi:integrase